MTPATEGSEPGIWLWGGRKSLETRPTDNSPGMDACKRHDDDALQLATGADDGFQSQT